MTVSPSVVGARVARSGFAASGKPRIAHGASSPHATSVPRGDPDKRRATSLVRGRLFLMYFPYKMAPSDEGAVSASR